MNVWQKIFNDDLNSSHYLYSGQHVDYDQHSCSTSGPVTIRMGHCLWTHSQYITNQSAQLRLPSLWGKKGVNLYSASRVQHL